LQNHPPRGCKTGIPLFLETHPIARVKNIEILHAHRHSPVGPQESLLEKDFRLPFFHENQTD